MKKLSKLALLAAAIALTAGLAGCFVSAVEDDGPEVRTVTLDDLKLGDKESLTDVAAKDPAIVSVEAGGSAKAVAAARAAATITTFTITPKKQGSTHIILTVTGGDTDTLYLPVTVSSDLKLSLGTVTDKEPEESAGGGATTYTLESSALTAFAKGSKTDADETTEGTDGYFTISWSTSMAVDASAKTWDDGYSSGQRISMGGGWTGSKQFIKFTTTKAATVKVWWASNEKPLAIAKFTGSTPADTIDSTDAGVKNNAYIAEFSLKEAGTWVVGFVGGGGYIFKVEVNE